MNSSKNEINVQNFQFYIENHFLTINEKKWFTTREVKKIDCSSIVELEYNSINKNVNIFRAILYYIVSIFLFFYFLEGDRLNKKYLHIIYLVDGEKAIFTLDVELDRKDFFSLRDFLLKENRKG